MSERAHVPRRVKFPIIRPTHCPQTCKPGDKVVQESSSQDKSVSIRNPTGQESIVSQVKKFTIWRNKTIKEVRWQSNLEQSLLWILKVRFSHKVPFLFYCRMAQQWSHRVHQKERWCRHSLVEVSRLSKQCGDIAPWYLTISIWPIWTVCDFYVQTFKMTASNTLCHRVLSRISPHTPTIHKWTWPRQLPPRQIDRSLQDRSLHMWQIVTQRGETNWGHIWTQI